MSEVKNFTSGFDFICKACGTEGKKGDVVYKVGNGVWCTDKDCTGVVPDKTAPATAQEAPSHPAATATAPEPTPKPAPESPSPPAKSMAAPNARQRFNEWLGLHNSVWTTSISLADTADPNAEARSKIIMAQVFYKTAFNYINKE